MNTFTRLVVCCFLLLGLRFSAWATHIVGGELELQHLGNRGGGFSHQINLNLYFDDLNGNPQAEDQSVNVYIFRKLDNQLMAIATLPRISNQLIEYTDPDCAISSLQTRLIRYSVGVNLLPTVYNSPAGYYMVWERCCRNNIINNIQNPGAAGSVFYLEFPSQAQNGTPVVNSSPVFRQLKGDYICVNQPFTFDFGGRDPDGDSLVYTLVTPYNGFATAANPTPRATPSSSYPEVRWSSGIDLNSVIPGPQPLRVDPRTGRLSVTANRTGLYVFSVQVEEYRNRQRIGLVRREFQLKVIDCPNNRPPSLLMRPTGQRTFYQEGTLLKLNATTDNACFDLFVTDRDANQRIQLTPLAGQGISLRIVQPEVFIRNGGDTARTQVCFDLCSIPTDGRTVTLSVLARDEGCPQGLQDTLRIRVQLDASANRPPDSRTDLSNNRATVQVGQPLTFQVFGTDPDKDQLTLEAVGRGFTLAQVGMSFPQATGTGEVSQRFQWTPQCAQLRSGEYVIDFIVTDTRCDRKQRDTVTVRLTAAPQTGNPPAIRTTAQNTTIEITLPPTDETQLPVRFDVIGTDPDPDVLRLTAQGKDFDWKAVGMQFEEKTGRSPLQSPFAWTPGCETLGGRSERTFVMNFTVNDNSCITENAKTTAVTFVVRDRVVNGEPMIPNVFTPNGDGKNDFFTVTDLPADNCSNQFKRVEIVNRWGRTVFSSTDRRFRWDGEGYPSGQYFYRIEYTNRQYKGPVTLLR